MVNSSQSSVPSNSSSISIPSYKSSTEQIPKTVKKEKVTKKKKVKKTNKRKVNKKKKTIEIEEVEEEQQQNSRDYLPDVILQDNGSSNEVYRQDIKLEDFVHHRRRNALVNLPLKKTNTLLLVVRMHGGLFSEETTGKCRIEKSPFEVMFRYIIGSAWEYQNQTAENVEEVKKAFEEIPETDLTPKLITDKLRQVDNVRDEYPLLLPFIDPEEVNTQINIGFHLRKHSLINYYQSPYCTKIYSHNDETPSPNADTKTFHYGIHCMNQVKNGWGLNQNILFDQAFIDWVKQKYPETPLTFAIRKLRGQEFLHTIMNNILYEYISDVLKIKRVFIIDMACESDYWDEVKPDAPITLIPLRKKRTNHAKAVKNKIARLINKMEQIIDARLPVEDDDFERFLLDDNELYKLYLQNIDKFSKDDRLQIENFKTEIEDFNEVLESIKDSTNHNEELSNAYKNTLKHVKRLRLLKKQPIKTTKQSDKIKMLSMFGSDSDDTDDTDEEDDDADVFIDEDTTSDDINQDIKVARRNFYQQSKTIFPEIRKTKKFIRNAKQNKGNHLWHVSKVNDLKYR